MHPVSQLICYGLRQVIGDYADRLVEAVESRFTDHGQALPKALTTANDRAWQSLSIAPAGDGFLDQLKVFFARGDDKGIRDQVRRFLANNTFDFAGSTTAFRRACLAELKQARAAGLLAAPPFAAADLARQTAAFQYHADPSGMVAGAWQVVGCMADTFAVQHPNLAELLRKRPPSGPPLLVATFAYFFRREVETAPELFRGLQFDGLRQLAAQQETAFAAVHDALAHLGSHFDAVLQEVLNQLDRILCEVQQTHAADTNSLGMRFVRVPAGTFWISGEGGKPGDRQVGIAQDFYLGVHAVTQEQWQEVMGNNPSHFSRSGVGKNKVKKLSDAELKQFPVENVSWEDVQQFIEKLNAREKNGGWVYRLPAVAEWEYACRGGATSQEDCSLDFYFGGPARNLSQPTNDLSSQQANFDGNFPAGKASKGPYFKRTTKVGSYKPNRLGLYDMHGNVWEWCEDAQGSDRVLCGGSWSSHGTFCRAAYRVSSAPSWRSRDFGFRLARVPTGG